MGLGLDLKDFLTWVFSLTEYLKIFNVRLCYYNKILIYIHFIISRSEMEDCCEAEFKGKASQWILDESKLPAFPLTLLRTQPNCEVYPDLHKIIQVYLKI